MARSRKRKDGNRQTAVWWRITTALLAAVVAVVVSVSSEVIVDLARTHLPFYKSSGPALTVIDVTRLANGTHFVFPRGLSDTQLKALNENHAGLTEELIKESGAVAIGRATWEIALQSRRDEPIEIVNLRHQIEGSCGQPVRGTLVENLIARSADKIPLELNIDEPRAVAMERRYGTDGAPIDTPYFAHRKITLEKGTIAIFVVTARSGGASCRWKFVVDYLADGRRGSQVIANSDDTAFTVTGSLPPQEYDSVVLSPLRGCGKNYSYQRIKPDEYARLGHGRCPR